MNPIFKITADKNDVTELIAKRLVSISITDETGLTSDTCEIILDNKDDVLEIPARGANLEVSLGYDDNWFQSKSLVKMGSYIVDEVECSSPPSQIRITAKASNSDIKDLNKNLRAPKSKSWRNYTIVGIVTSIAKTHHLEGVVDEYYLQIFIPHIDQTDESDISFLNSLAKHYGAFIKVSNGKLLFFKKGRSISASGIELPTIKISEQEITDWKLSISNNERFGKVIAKWHNFATGKEETVSAGNVDPPYNLRYKFATKDRALAAAKAKLAEFQMSLEKLSVSLAGNPSLSAENKIIISGIKYLKDKTWIIDSVHHQLSDQGFITSLTAVLKLPDDDEAN